MRAVMIFIDGIGLGENDPDSNPFIYTPMPRMSRILHGNLFCKDSVGFHGRNISLLGLETGLGVPGVPQSATGQAALFTGENAPLLLGRHLRGFPNKPLQKLLQSRGLFSRLRLQGFKTSFLNAYRPEFFSVLEKGPARSFSCSTLLTFYAGLPFRTLDDLNKGNAVYMDITNEVLRKMGFDVGIISPEEAAVRLVNLTRDFDFSLFEFFLSDMAGHLADRNNAAGIVGILDEFFGTVIESTDFGDTLLVITSDHGNLEEINHKNHTINPVPALIGGTLSVRKEAASRLKDITGVAGLIQDFLSRSLKCQCL